MHTTQGQRGGNRIGELKIDRCTDTFLLGVKSNRNPSDWGKHLESEVTVVSLVTSVKLFQTAEVTARPDVRGRRMQC